MTLMSELVVTVSFGKEGTMFCGNSLPCTCQMRLSSRLYLTFFRR